MVSPKALRESLMLTSRWYRKCQAFWDILALDERARRREGFELTFDVQCADNGTVRTLATKQMVTAWLAAQRALTGNTGIVERGGSGEEKLSAYLHEKVDRLVRAEAALPSDHAKAGACHGLEEATACWD